MSYPACKSHVPLSHTFSTLQKSIHILIVFFDLLVGPLKMPRLVTVCQLATDMFTPKMCLQDLLFPAASRAFPLSSLSYILF